MVYFLTFSHAIQCPRFFILIFFTSYLKYLFTQRSYVCFAFFGLAVPSLIGSYSARPIPLNFFIFFYFTLFFSDYFSHFVYFFVVLIYFFGFRFILFYFLPVMVYSSCSKFIFNLMNWPFSLIIFNFWLFNLVFL